MMARSLFYAAAKMKIYLSSCALSMHAPKWCEPDCVPGLASVIKCVIKVPECHLFFLLVGFKCLVPAGKRAACGNRTSLFRRVTVHRKQSKDGVAE